jgi:hypothetical protein
MNRFRRIRKSSITEFVLLVAFICAASLMALSLAQPTKDRSPKAESQRKSMPSKNPCWFLEPDKIKSKEDKVAYKKYRDRQMYGYPEDISLKEAIRIFNKETYCSGPDPKRPPLTEDEVVAGAIDEMVKGGTEPVARSYKVTSPERKAALERIWKDRVMPKGSLLDADGYYSRYDENKPDEGIIEVNCWKVYLYIGLDKNPREDGFLRPDQICLIRKTCFGIQQKVPKNK